MIGHLARYATRKESPHHSIASPAFLSPPFESLTSPAEDTRGRQQAPIVSVRVRHQPARDLSVAQRWQHDFGFEHAEVQHRGIRSARGAAGFCRLTAIPHAAAVGNQRFQLGPVSSRYRVSKYAHLEDVVGTARILVAHHSRAPAPAEDTRGRQQAPIVSVGYRHQPARNFSATQRWQHGLRR